MPDEKELFYSNIADQFDSLMNPYDLEQRLHIVFERLLPENIRSKKLLDLGCGNGWFSLRAVERGAQVYSIDISHAMAKIAQQRVKESANQPPEHRVVNASALELPLPENYFDVVLSSEMIEHTPSPRQAITEMARVLKPEGILVITTPNRCWQWLVDLGTRLGIRPFEGIENFSSYRELEEYFVDSRLEIQEHFGFHPWPFQLRFLQPLSRKIDLKYSTSIWGRWMINQAIRAIKPV